jgi:ribosome-binding ATPase YchF (GTP1/OBG family)
VEFTDIVVARGGAQALVDVAGYKNADALVHVVRAFRDPAVAHPAGSIDPARDAQTMEDELILADLGVAERRVERIEKDLKRGKSTELEKERELVQRCKDALEHGTPLRALQLAGDDLKRLRGFQFLSAKPLLLVMNLDESEMAEVGADVGRAAQKIGLAAFLAHASTGAVALCTKIELEIAQLGAEDAKAFLADLGLHESGLDRVIRTSYDLPRIHLVLHRRRG